MTSRSLEVPFESSGVWIEGANLSARRVADQQHVTGKVEIRRRLRDAPRFGETPLRQSHFEAAAGVEPIDISHPRYH